MSSPSRGAPDSLSWCDSLVVLAPLPCHHSRIITQGEQSVARHHLSFRSNAKCTAEDCPSCSPAIYFYGVSLTPLSSGYPPLGLKETAVPKHTPGKHQKLC